MSEGYGTAPGSGAASASYTAYMSPSIAVAPRRWIGADDCRLADFVATVEQVTSPADYPHAAAVDREVVVYEAGTLAAPLRTPEGRRAIQAELAAALLDGPGIVLFAGAFADTAVVDGASDAFRAMIEDQHAAGAAAGDHFAPPGANDRVWNALEKLAVRAPDVFADYYANDIVAVASAAWLGPGYQITSQVNVVNPGGGAQSADRDYHLGFLSDEVAAAFPAHVHRLSPMLTLQGAVAHVDMPVESGPTTYLPHSHKYEPGYLAWRRPEFREYFDQHLVQLPLAKGDAVFFNPALFHAAGHNRTVDVRRMANLLQMSSPFGRAMESVDRDRMAMALFPTLRARHVAGVDEQDISNVIAAAAEGYPFPTNLDRDPPIDGLAPESNAELLRRAVGESWSPSALGG